MGAGSIIFPSMIQRSPHGVHTPQALLPPAQEIIKKCRPTKHPFRMHIFPIYKKHIPHLQDPLRKSSALQTASSSGKPPTCNISLSPHARNNLSAEVYTLSAATFHGRGSPAA